MIDKEVVSQKYKSDSKGSVTVQMVKTSDPLCLPRVFIDERNQLPECPAVYYVLWRSKVLYVGSTKNLRKRFLNHHRAGAFDVFESVEIAWQEMDKAISLRDLRACESEAISVSMPILNDESNRKATNQFYEYICLEVPKSALPYLAKMAQSTGGDMEHVLSTLLEDLIFYLQNPSKRPQALWVDEEY